MTNLQIFYWIVSCETVSIIIVLEKNASVVVTSPKLTLMATLIGEVHNNFGIRNSVCRLLRIFIVAQNAQNINIVY